MYHPNKGGHAPGHLRDAFVEMLDAAAAQKLPITAETTIPVGDHDEPVLWLIGRLWNCTDCLPSSFCDELGLQSGASYAQGVRALKAQLAA